MVLNWAKAALAAVIIAMACISVSSVAHKDHDKKQAEQATPPTPTATTLPHPGHTAAPATASQTMGEVMSHGPSEGDSSFTARFFDWLGRLHPIVVHFPIAFFPAALFTAIVGRRRPTFAAPVQFLVVAGGIIAPVSAVLGWLDATGMDPDPLLTVHRWLGTAIGALAIPLATWAWRKPEQDRSGLMIAGLAIITAAILVQGWYGGALVHGMDHLNW